MGGFAQAYTLYSSVRPFGITAIIGGVDEDGKPGLYMIEPSGLYWVRASNPKPPVSGGVNLIINGNVHRVTLAPLLAKVDKLPKLKLKSLTL